MFYERTLWQPKLLTVNCKFLYLAYHSSHNATEHRVIDISAKQSSVLCARSYAHNDMAHHNFYYVSAYYSITVYYDTIYVCCYSMALVLVRCILPPCISTYGFERIANLVLNENGRTPHIPSLETIKT